VATAQDRFLHTQAAGNGGHSSPNEPNADYVTPYAAGDAPGDRGLVQRHRRSDDHL
jgi:hypothetical protein